MVLTEMKGFLKIFFLVLLAILFSCEEKGWFTECSDCTSTEPEKANLIVKLGVTSSQVVINIYEGELEDGILYYSVTPMSSVYKIPVGLNKTFTATATYITSSPTNSSIINRLPASQFNISVALFRIWSSRGLISSVDVRLRLISLSMFSCLARYAVAFDGTF